MSSNKNVYADRLREILGDMTVRAFAQTIGKSPSTVQEYLKGRVPPADFAATVCERFEISERWFLTGEGPRKRNAFTVNDEPTAYKRTLVDLPEKHLELLKAFDQLDEVRQNRIIFAAQDAALAFRQSAKNENPDNDSKDSKSKRRSNG